jgi:hypothetical protein
LLGPPSSADLFSVAAAADGGGGGGPAHLHHQQQQQQQASPAADGAESDDSDDLLPPSADPPATNWQQQAARVSNSGSTASYRALRAAMRHPGAGVEFPGLGGTSDGEAGGDGDSSGLSDEEEEGVKQQQQQQREQRERERHSAGTDGAEGVSHPPHPTAPTTTITTSSSGLAGPILDSVCLIDYEYAGFNPIAFDVANHWCEWAADYHTDTPHILDYSRVPSPQQQQLFVEAYLATLLQQAGLQVPAAATAMLPLPVVTMPPSPALQQQLAQDSAAVAARLAAEGSGSPTLAAAAIAADPLALRSLWLWLEAALSAADVSPARHPLSPGDPVAPGAWRKLVAQVMAASRAYMAVSHLLWALWGYIQAEVSDVDFDFLSYGEQRLREYLTSRPPQVAAAAEAAAAEEAAPAGAAGEGGSPPVVAELLLR